MRPVPALLAPVGYSRLMHPGGEVAAARAAGAAGTAYILSTISGHRLEDVMAASSGRVFYQLYLLGGRGAAEAAIERARQAGLSALLVTIDTAVSGMRERDIRNGMKELISGGVMQKIPFLSQILSRPGWLLSLAVFVRGLGVWVTDLRGWITVLRLGRQRGGFALGASSAGAHSGAARGLNRPEDQ